MTPMLLAVAVTVTVYWVIIRPWLGEWGTMPDERTRAMIGDSLIANPRHSATHAVTVDAPPDDIWPWLVQLGSDRGGLYSYDWLDRLFGILDRPSATRILPEFQHLAVGDTIGLGPREQMTVVTCLPGKALVLRYNAHDFEWVWQFELDPLDARRTRLLSRGSERYATTVGAWLFMRVMEPAAFIMTRRMLLGLKERAETLRAARDGDDGVTGEAGTRQAA